MKTIKVVAAIIFREGKVMSVQRPEHTREYVSLKWEFPGGKVEVGEGLEEALVREIREELAVDVLVSDFLMTVEHAYPDFHLTMHVFNCVLPSGDIVLNEHVDMKWLFVEELGSLNWAAADVQVVERLIKVGN
jgi:8-oxo-dGTP diphosphatase